MGRHYYLVFVVIPTTTSLVTDKDYKMRLLGSVRADNSIEACHEASMSYDIDIDRLKVVLFKKAHDVWSIETYSERYVTLKRLN
tara:strand:+ start:1254 stop:1505 length:252 start_codon:yes stop_codon:yes gene_type:complete